MKVMLLNTQMAPGGAQKAMLTLARGLKEDGHDIIVVTMYDTGSYVNLFEAQYGLKIVDLRMKPEHGRNTPISAILATLRGLHRLYRLMRQTQPDLLQTFTHYSNIIGPPIAWLAGIPVRVSSQRSLLAHRPRWLLTTDRLVTNSFLVHKMTTVSDETRNFCIEQGIHPHKLLTIYSGINTSKYRCSMSPEQQLQLRQTFAIGQTDTIILTVARLSQEKGTVTY